MREPHIDPEVSRRRTQAMCGSEGAAISPPGTSLNVDCLSSGIVNKLLSVFLYLPNKSGNLNCCKNKVITNQQEQYGHSLAGKATEAYHNHVV